MGKRGILFLALIMIIYFGAGVLAVKCTVYFTGIGCPHCAIADPFLISVLTTAFPDLVIIEYELYQDSVNAPLISEYNERYGSGYGIPLLIAGNGEYIVGDHPIMNGAADLLESLKNDSCPLLTGMESFETLDLSTLPGNPKIWVDGKAMEGLPDSPESSELAKDYLFSENISATLEGKDYVILEPVPFYLSGAQVDFDAAVIYKGMRFQWVGDPIGGASGGNGSSMDTPTQKNTTSMDLILPKVISLAAVDAVNPCALAVLTLMLISIITYNPKKKRNILYAGFAFTASVFVMYLIYGLVIIRFFQLIQAITSVRLILYKLLGFAAIILGILNLKDFFDYKPGGLGTEMPMFLRPKVKKLISGITSPKGAFVVGMFVTVFLLPCTIGPYVITGGMLSAMEILSTIPWLIIYNAIFVSPMIAITGIVYFGFSSVENVSEWKDKNIRYLHLVAGSIIIMLGIGMLLGWF